MHDPNDLEAMRRVQAGDRAAIAELYDSLSPLLYGLVLRIVRERADADDVLQETWVQAWKRSASFDPARGSVAAWLLTIARSRALDHVRRRKTRDRLEAHADARETRSAAPNPLEIATRSSVRDAIAHALGALDPKQREVLEIAYFEGLSQTEVAARVGAPVGTVKYWTRQGLIKLKELVAGDMR